MDFAYIVFVSACLLHSCLGQETVGFEIEISPSNDEQLFQLGDNRLLTCIASETADGQKPDLHWEIDNVKVTATSRSDRIRIEPRGNRLMLRVDNVQDGDDGTYKCVGTLGGQMDSRSTKVELFKALEVHSKEKQHGIFGQDGEVLCDATGQPAPSITWKFNNYDSIENNDKYVIQPNKLIIKNLDFSDKQTYLCDIVVVPTGMSKAFFIEYEVVKIPTIALPPTIQPNNPKVGDKVQMTCTADGEPKPTYKFKRNGNILPEAMVDEVNGILTIDSLTREDEATYTCIASNIGGTAEMSNTLDVMIPPVISDIPDVTDAVENGESRVTCVVEGDPEPTVTWRKEDMSQAYTEGTREQGPEIKTEGSTDRNDAQTKTVTSTMIFKLIRPQDAGNYVCVAFNPVGNVSKTVKFEVKYPPHFDTDFKQRVFYGWKGHTANMTCQTSANELANIQFYDPSPDAPDDIAKARRIENDAPFTVTSETRWAEYKLTSRSLMVYVSGDDPSIYRDFLCEAQNSMGTALETMTLKEAVPPQKPTVRVAETFSTMLILEVETPKENGGQKVTGYHYTYHPSGNAANMKEDDIDHEAETTRVNLMDLTPATTYDIRVNARNAVGLGTHMRITHETKNVSKPLKMGITSSQEGNDATTYRLEWAEPDDGGSPITEFTVQYRKVDVEGDKPSNWRVVGDTSTQFETHRVTNPSARSFTIRNLERDTYYDIRITAANKLGVSLPEQRIIKTSKGAEDEEEIADDNEKIEDSVDGEDGEKDEARKEEEDEGKGGETVGRTSDSKGAGGLGSGAIIGIILGLVVFILLLVAIIYLITKKKPELVGSLRGRLGGKGGEEERGAKEDGKDPAEEEKLIKKEDAVKVENETEEGKTGDVIAEHPEEFEPDSKPEAQAAPEPAKEETAEKPKELATPAPTTEIKITPETPEKPENPPA